MKLLFTILIVTFHLQLIIAQHPFILSLKQPDVDNISDVIKINTRYYFLQNRQVNLDGFRSDPNSDILVTSEDGDIIEEINLIGSFLFQRILKVENNEIFLVGYQKSDSCLSQLVISKFNINTRQLDQISSYDFCANIAFNINIIQGLNHDIFIDILYSDSLKNNLHKAMFRLNPDYTITFLLLDKLNYFNTISVDFARTGYVIAQTSLYYFYDINFNYRKLRYTGEYGNYFHETHIPFGRHYILEQYAQHYASKPDYGIQVRLVDSNLVIKKKATLLPTQTLNGTLGLPAYGGISVVNENEIWAAGEYGRDPFALNTMYSITKLDSNLNIICQHFLGNDSRYNILGISAQPDGGAIVFGSRLRDGSGIDDITLGQDIYVIRIGENCELPTIVSTAEPQKPVYSISAFPNPGFNSLTFSANGYDPATLRVELINESGELLFSKQDLTNSIPLPDLPRGQYFYRILLKDKLLGIGSWVKE